MEALIAIVLVCDLVTRRCDMIVSEHTFPDQATCTQVVEAGIRQQLAEQGPVDVKDNVNIVTFGWCEAKDLPYATK